MAIIERRFTEEKWGPLKRRVERPGVILSAEAQVSLGGTNNLSSPTEGLLGVVRSPHQVELYSESDGVRGQYLNSVFGDDINSDKRTRGRLRYQTDEDLSYLR